MPGIIFEQVEALLIQQLRRKQRDWLWGGLLLSVVGVLGTFALFKLSTSPDRSASGAVGMACVLTIPAIAGIANSLRDVRRSRALQTLRERATAVVWLYVSTVRGQGSQSWVVLGLDDGKLERVPVQRGREPEILAAVAQVAPWATTGFSPDRERAFLAAPASLRR